MPNSVNSPLVFVHGAWHGSWCFRLLRDALAGQGWTGDAVDMPSPGRRDGGPKGLADDTAVVRAAIEAAPASPIVVAHSYGGVPSTEAVASLPAGAVAGIVYVCAYRLEAGQSLASMAGMQLPPIDYLPTPADPLVNLYNGVEANLAAESAAKLVEQSTKAFGDTLSAEVSGIPRGYVICDEDRMLPPETQVQMADGLEWSTHLPSGHSPFLSMTSTLADRLIEFFGVVTSTNG